MFRGFHTMLWLKAKHLRAELNFWLWAAGVDLDDAQDMMERLYLLYVALLASAAIGACWVWLLGLVTGSAYTEGAVTAAITADVARALAAGALVIPACATALWLMGAGWRAPWSPSAPDAAWLAQLPIAVAGWSTLELAPHLLTRGVIAGCIGYLIASYTVTAAGQEATLAACLPYALVAGLVTGTGYTLAWLMGEIRIRAGRAKRYVLALCSVAAGAALVALSITAFPLVATFAGMLLPGGAPALPIIFAIALLAATVAASALFARRLTPALLTREAATDASLYAVRRMAVYNPKLYKSLVRSQRAAFRRPFGRMPRAQGRAAILARAVISTVRHYEALPQVILAGAFVAPMGVLLLSGALARQSAAFGLLGGEIGARIMGAASWIMLAVSGLDAQRSLARVFLADTRNRFMRDHLPVPTLVLFVLGTLPAVVVALAASAVVSIAAVFLGTSVVDAFALFFGDAALVVTLACCGAMAAEDPTRNRARLSCEAMTAIAAALCALAAALAPAGCYAPAFWVVTALVAAISCTRM